MVKEKITLLNFIFTFFGYFFGAFLFVVLIKNNIIVTSQTPEIIKSIVAVCMAFLFSYLGLKLSKRLRLIF